MGYLATNLSTYLSNSLSTSFCPFDVKAKFTDSTFTNASHRMLSYGDDDTSVTLFEPGTLATRRLDNRNFCQIELAVKNEFTQTQSFSHTDWAKTRATVTANNTTAPDGFDYADKLVEDATAANTHYILQAATPDGSSDYVFSVYAKAAGRTWIQLQISTAGFSSAVNGYYDLANGVVGTSTGVPSPFGIEDAGNGWYRCYIGKDSDAAAASNFTVYLAEADNDRTFDGDGASGIYLWNAQLEIGTYPTSPIMAGENLFIRSQDLETAGFASDFSTVTPNVIADPLGLGTITADKLTEDVGIAEQHILRQSITPDGSSQYTFSLYAKAAERIWIRVQMQGQGFVGIPYSNFNLSTGVEGTTSAVDDSGIEDVGNGWYRCWIVATSDAAAATQIRCTIGEDDNDVTYDGDGVSGLFLWGYQIETGVAPGPYVHTEASAITGAITRAKDQLKWASADVPNALRGKFTLKWIPRWDEGSPPNSISYLFTMNNSGASLRVNLYYWGGTRKLRVLEDGVEVALSDALTFSRNQIITITLNPAVGSITVAGATTGNGTNTDTPWATTEGDVWWGMTQASANQANSLLSEPY